MSGTVHFVDWWRNRPSLLRAVFFGALGLFVLFDVFVERHEAHFFGDHLRGFWALFGLVGCTVLAKGMKGLGRLWLMKPVDYYTRDEEKE